MKEHILVAGDEIVIRDLDPVLVSNKRIYIRYGYRKKKKKVQIIELDKVSSVHYIKKRHPTLRVLSFLFLFLTAVFAGVAFYLYSGNSESYERLKMPLMIGGIAALIVALVFLLLFIFIRKKAIRIEYSGCTRANKFIIIRKASEKKVIELVRSIFLAIDGLNPLSVKNSPRSNYPIY